MSNKTEIPPAVAEFAISERQQLLARIEEQAQEIERLKGTLTIVREQRDAELIANDILERDLAALKAKPSVKQLEGALESVRCFHDMSAELIAPAMFEHLCKAAGTSEPHYTAHLDVRDLIKDAD